MAQIPSNTPVEDPRAQIAAIVAHQLRNRLSRVVFGVEALTHAAGPAPELAPATARVRRGVDELVLWFDQLIELVRVMSGSAELRSERLDLVMLVEAAVERVRPLVEARHQRLRVELPDAPLWIDGDALGLDVALANVLTNAVKFTPSGGKIDVELSAGREVARLVVRDTGIGIAPQRLARVFEPFAQEELAPGTPSGIRAGLYLARAVVAMHHGELAVTSEGEGRGSEFAFTFPHGKILPMPIEVDAALRALVVHPRRGMAGMLAALLRSWGYHVHSALDAAAALEEARSFSPALVVMDAHLSEESAHLLPLKVREATKVAGARVLLVGADAASALINGVDAQLTGALDPDLLHAALRPT